MKFVAAIWKLLVGIKDALVLLLLIIFFAGLYGALSARPAPVKDGVLDLELNGSLVEQPARRNWADVAGSPRLDQYRLRDLIAAMDKAREANMAKDGRAIVTSYVAARRIGRSRDRLLRGDHGCARMARARLDFRLVPDLSPELIIKLLRAHLDAREFHDIEIIEIASAPYAKSASTSTV